MGRPKCRRAPVQAGERCCEDLGSLHGGRNRARRRARGHKNMVGSYMDNNLVGGLEHFFYFPIYWVANHPNLLIFFRGVQTTNQDNNYQRKGDMIMIIWEKTWLDYMRMMGELCYNHVGLLGNMRMIGELYHMIMWDYFVIWELYYIT